MKTIQLLFVSALFSCLFFNVNAQRQSVSLNKEWGFKGASLWEDSIEQVVDLPHTWNTEDAAEGRRKLYQKLFCRSFFKRKAFIFKI